MALASTTDAPKSLRNTQNLANSIKAKTSKKTTSKSASSTNAEMKDSGDVIDSIGTNASVDEIVQALDDNAKKNREIAKAKLHAAYATLTGTVHSIGNSISEMISEGSKHISTVAPEGAGIFTNDTDYDVSKVLVNEDTAAIYMNKESNSDDFIAKTDDTEEIVSSATETDPTKWAGAPSDVVEEALKSSDDIANDRYNMANEFIDYSGGNDDYGYGMGG